MTYSGARASELPFQRPRAATRSWVTRTFDPQLGSALAARFELAPDDRRLALAWVALTLRRYGHHDEVCLALGGPGPARRVALHVGLPMRFDELLAAAELALAAPPLPVSGDELWLRFDEETPQPSPSAPAIITWAREGPRALRFDRQRISAARGHAFAAAFARLAAGLVTTRDAAIGQLELLSRVERDEQLEDFAGPSVALPPGRTVLDTFAAQVAATPEADAIIERGRALPYAELARIVEEVAAGLRTHATLGPDAVVMVMLPSSIDFVAAMLGIMAAGAAYLPVDPDYPSERVREILRASRARIVISDVTHEGLPASARVESLVELRATGRRALLGEDLDADARAPGPELADPAYVIFTSGSTGAPKGIVQTHRCLANFLAWQAEASGLGRGRRVLQHAALSFDVSVQELLYTLTTGGCLILTDASLRRDPSALLRFIIANEVEVVDFPFSLINLLLGLSPGLEQATSLTDIISAGEPLRMVPALRELLERRPELRLHNHYGPAETHMLTSHTMSAAAGTIDPRPPLGRAIWNMRAYVLDELLGLVPRGVVGEICISGPGLARGYSDPALERDKFIAHPFRRGERLYRSGDLGRWRDDGALEILGRSDDLVKVRGYRVELGEIERRLLAHPAIDEAAVIVELRAGTGSLHAVVSGRATTVLALRHHLERSLPEYMLPQRWSCLERLPRSPNGKIARRELPGSSARPLAIGGAEAAPTGELERSLAELWEELLGVAPIARDDDLFDLGCDSLSATRALAAIRARLGVRLELRALYLAPTIAGLATRIQALRPSSKLEITREPASDDAVDHPLSSAQRGMWMASAGSSVYNFSALFELDARTDAATLECALARLCQRHEVLRTTYAIVAGEPRQRVHDQLPIALSVHELDDDALLDAAARAWAERDTSRPFALEREAPLRAHALLGPCRALLILSVHHIAADAWSLAEVEAQLGELLAAAHDARSPALEPVPLQIRDLARWQQNWLQSAEAEALRQRARTRLGDARSPRLPSDRQAPHRVSHAGALLELELDARPAQALARAEGASLYMVTLAAFSITLARLCGVEDMLIGATGSGRLTPGLERCVGLYAELMAVRVELAGARTFTDAIARARAGVLAAHDEQMLPYTSVVAALGRTSEAGCDPLFDVGFQLLPPPRSRARGALRWRETVWAEGSRAHLWFSGVELDDRISFRVEYSSELFDRATVETLVARYEATLAELVASPAATLELRAPSRATATLTAQPGSTAPEGWFDLNL